jgi:hypothetical protein
MLTLLSVALSLHVSDALSVHFDFYVQTMRCRFARIHVLSSLETCSEKTPVCAECEKGRFFVPEEEANRVLSSWSREIEVP